MKKPVEIAKLKKQIDARFAGTSSELSQYSVVQQLECGSIEIQFRWSSDGKLRNTLKLIPLGEDLDGDELWRVITFYTDEAGLSSGKKLATSTLHAATLVTLAGLAK